MPPNEDYLPAGPGSRPSMAVSLSVFVCGAVLMMFELTGSRVLGPYFGTSIVVWTSLIGIILGSLALGSHLGGRLADRSPQARHLARLIFLAGVCIALTNLIKRPALECLQDQIPDIRFAAILGSVLLFGPAAILLGTVPPYAVRLRLAEVATAGAVTGNLFAISTVGSIAGTFLAGFYAIPTFGTATLLNLLAGTLLILSFLVSPTLRGFEGKTKAVVVLMLVPVAWLGRHPDVAVGDLLDVDTAYNRIWIHDQIDGATGRKIRTMGINNENHSARFLDGDDLYNAYTRFFHLARHFHPGGTRALMIGGGGYCFPKAYLQQNPHARIDVVEIDPGVTALAEKYFDLRAQPGLTIYHQDGRVFLNQAKQRYDFIFGDAFSSHYALPFHLATREAVQAKHRLLHEGGVVLVNVISAIEGDKGRFVRAQVATYRSVFPHVYLFPVDDPTAGRRVQNILLVALKTPEQPTFHSADPMLNAYLQHLWRQPVPPGSPIFTDDYAPVDSFLRATQLP